MAYIGNKKVIGHVFVSDTGCDIEIAQTTGDSETAEESKILLLKIYKTC